MASPFIQALLNPGGIAESLAGGVPAAGVQVGGTAGPQVVDTSGNQLGLGGAIGGIGGSLVEHAIPGMALGGMLGRGLRSLAGGPFGVIGAFDTRPRFGTPEWQARQRAIRVAQRRNRAVARAPGRTTRAFQGLSSRGRDAAHDRQGHGGGGQLGRDRDTRAGGPR